MPFVYTTNLSEVRALAEKHAGEAGLPDDRVVDFVIAVSEIVANTVRHARSAGSMEMAGSMEIWTSGGEVLCEIRDAGVITDPLAGATRRRQKPTAATACGSSTRPATGWTCTRFSGPGNIAAAIVGDGTRSGMISVPGIAGHQARAIRQFEYTAPSGAAVILHSDGISARWEAAALPGMNATDPLVIAAALFAQDRTRRDDAGVLVLKP